MGLPQGTSHRRSCSSSAPEPRRRDAFTEFHALQASTNPFRERLSVWSARLRRQRVASPHTEGEPPLRAELYSADQMEQHGRRLAGAH